MSIVKTYWYGSVILLGAGMLLGFGQQVAEAAAPGPTLAVTAGQRPEAVPDNYVITPSGYFDPACVVAVERGEHVRQDGGVERADGSLRLQPHCNSPHFSQMGDKVGAGSSAPPRGTTSLNQWVAWSATDASTPTTSLSSISATWTVPSAPTTKSGQVVYYFPGLEQLPSPLSILQPVLGWNAFKDNAWTLSSWNCCISGMVYNSSPVKVAVGDVIYGLASGSATSASYPTNWIITTEDTTSGASTTLFTAGEGQVFNWPFSGALEAYGISNCSQYPASGAVEFSGVSVLDNYQNPVAPNWQVATTSASPQCGYAVTASPSDTAISLIPTSTKRGRQ